MAIRLQKNRDPYWIDLADGVSVKVHPDPGGALAAAKAMGTRKCQALKEKRDKLLDEKKSVDHLPNLEYDAVQNAISWKFTVIGLAVFAVVEWKGVLGPKVNEEDEDQIAELTEDNLTELFMDDAQSNMFLARYKFTHEKVEDEVKKEEEGND